MIREGKVGVTSRQGREQPGILMTFLQPGDGLVVTRVDRLARSIGDLQDVVRELRQRKVALVAAEQPVDTSTAADEAFLDMLGAFAEFETNLRRERQMEGIARAKARGVYKGRKPSVDTERVRALHAEGKGPMTIAEEVGASRSTVWRVLSRGRHET